MSQWLSIILPIAGTAAMAAGTWILRTLSQQNKAMSGQTQALAVLIAQVDPAIKNVDRVQSLEVAQALLEGRVKSLENKTQH